MNFHLGYRNKLLQPRKCLSPDGDLGMLLMARQDTQKDTITPPMNPKYQKKFIHDYHRKNSPDLIQSSNLLPQPHNPPKHPSHSIHLPPSKSPSNSRIRSSFSLLPFPSPTVTRKISTSAVNCTIFSLCAAMVRVCSSRSDLISWREAWIGSEEEGGLVVAVVVMEDDGGVRPECWD